MCRRAVILGLCLLFVGLRPQAQAWVSQTISFSAINKIDLQNTTGSKTKLEFSGKTLHLFVMLSPECPLCKNYSVVLSRIASKYAGNLQLLGIVPGRTYTGDTLQRFAQDYKINFPLLIDADMRLAQYLKASVTPEVILADTSGAVIYRGAIDDWMLELGKKKPAPQQHYLDDAINQYLNGQPVFIRSTMAKGCLINEF